MLYWAVSSQWNLYQDNGSYCRPSFYSLTKVTHFSSFFRVWKLNDPDQEKKKGFSTDVVDEEENWWEVVDLVIHTSTSSSGPGIPGISQAFPEFPKISWN